MNICRVAFLLILLMTGCLQASVADLVVFSYNRPIQLYAFLESAQTLMMGTGEMHVIYRADNDDFAEGYNKVASEFGRVIFHRQGATPKTDFKPLTMEAAFETPNDYVVFAVDDIIVKDFLDLSHAIAAMEKTNAYAFYPRLGRNLNYCYSENKEQVLPPMVEISPGVFAWQFSEGTLEFNYPHSVDMTIFRKKDIKADFDEMTFANPNLLESHWAERGAKRGSRLGLCYATTKIVNVPLNRVQTTFSNRHMNLLSAEELLESFNAGKKIDIAPLFRFNNLSPHSEYEPTFVERKPPSNSEEL